ncbi:hypothetical protein CYMTET_34742, partial [Cymbomonas tetramitiformis]
AYTEFSGRMKPLPDWSQDGAIIGMTGGAARVAWRTRPQSSAGAAGPGARVSTAAESAAGVVEVTMWGRECGVGAGVREEHRRGERSRGGGGNDVGAGVRVSTAAESAAGVVEVTMWGRECPAHMQVKEVVSDLQGAGVPVVGVWMQDWTGIRNTSLVERIWWNWVLDEAHYPDWARFLQELDEAGVKILTYVNPFLMKASGPKARALTPDCLEPPPPSCQLQTYP